MSSVHKPESGLTQLCFDGKQREEKRQAGRTRNERRSVWRDGSNQAYAHGRYSSTAMVGCCKAARNE